MNESIKEELTAHVKELIEGGRINSDNLGEAHFIAFNEDYYIIGYYNAEQWLQKHCVCPFEAVAYVIEKELETFGEVNIKAEDINSERIVNLIAYYAGDEIDIAELYEDKFAES